MILSRRGIAIIWVLESVVLVLNVFLTFGDFYLMSGLFGTKGSFDMFWKHSERLRLVSVVCYIISAFFMYFPLATLKEKKWFYLLPAQITVTLHALWTLIIYLIFIIKTSKGFAVYFKVTLSFGAIAFLIMSFVFIFLSIWILFMIRRLMKVQQ